MCALLRYAKISLANRKVLILGTGGTSKTAVAVAKHLGAREIIKASRTAKEYAVSYEEAYAHHADAEIIINTTPVGMFPNIQACPIDIDRFPCLAGVADAIYNPLRSQLVSHALKKGISAIGGLYMLVAQAALASEKFIDRPIAEETIEKVYQTLLTNKENIVLIGMPGCGKTTIGRRVAQALGRNFLDIDEAIVKRIGMTIPEYFEKFGENAFRDVESSVIAEEVAPLTSTIIATGGGAVLRPENVKSLKRNGKLYFLNAHVNRLQASDSRPLADTKAKIEALYRERLPIYRAAADVTVPDMAAAAEEADYILHKRMEMIL
jgi:shikimate dehydrogenase